MERQDARLAAILERRVNRRRALQLIGGTTVAGLIAACTDATSSASPGGTAPATGSAGSAAPSSPSTGSDLINGDVLADLPRGGTITVGIGDQVPSNLDTLTDSAGSARWASEPAHDKLEYFDHAGELRLSLASSMEIVDETTLRYVLHEGVTFHDGRPVTAESVAELFEWLKDPDNGSWLADVLAAVTTSAIDELTVELAFDQPDAGFRRQLAYLPIVPVDSLEQQAAEPIGCGPFVFEEWVRDSHIQWRRNENYWHPEAPRLDTLRVNYYGDTTAGAQAFLAGETDLYSSVPGGLVAEFTRRSEAGEFGTYPAESGFTYIGFNISKAPFDDVNVRRAILLAVDRAPMADAPFGGVARPFPVPMSPEFPFYPASIEADLSRQDLDEARQLLSDAGHPNGFTETLLTPSIDYFQGIATILQSQLAEIGITLELNVLDVPTLLEERNAGNFGALLLGNSNQTEPTTILTRHFRTGDTWAVRFGDYSNPEVDDLLDQAKSTFDEAERRTLYEEALRIALVDDVAMISLTAESILLAYRNHTNGEQWGPNPDEFRYQVAARLS